jgi:DNA polymerase
MDRLSARQKHCLKAMDIQLWEERTTAHRAQAVQTFSGTGQPPTATRSIDEWLSLQHQVKQCVRCELHKTRTQTVFGVGDESADWMFVGEAPGAEEDRQGLPFVGRAGQLLTAMITALGMRREKVYIANVLKCRPPNNRDPMGTEVRTCESFLHQQVAHVQPQIIIALGRFAAQSLVKTTRPIGKLRNHVYTFEDTGIPLVVTYHPAYLLRNPLDKRKTWQDLCLAKKVLEAV